VGKKIKKVFFLCVLFKKIMIKNIEHNEKVLPSGGALNH